MLGLCLVSAPLRAAEPDAPPARVGQLAYIGGSARLLGDGSAEWTDAALNTPVVAHTALATEPTSRAEIRIGSASLWLAPRTQIGMTTLDDHAMAVELVQGRLVLRLPALAPGERCSIAAEAARITVTASGAYRADYEPRRRRLVFSVVQGQAQLALDRGELTLGADQWAAVDVDSRALLEQGSGVQRVPLDELAEKREQRDARSQALARLPAGMTGAEALDGHGSWRVEPGYGSVWYPRGLPLDWAPYRYGHWVWLRRWGWNWVDDAVWGFAPTHYGRWVFLGGLWGWVPGAVVRPVYAPALVGFYGHADGAAWTPTAGGPAMVGWYPLAPGEVYWPAYAADLAYARVLNAASVADSGALRAWPDARDSAPAQRYARTAFAATAVPEAAFRSAQPVAGNFVAMAPAALAQAPVSARRAPPAFGGAAAPPIPATPPRDAAAAMPRAQRGPHEPRQGARPHPNKATSRPHPLRERLAR